jgi:cytochrome P450
MQTVSRIRPEPESSAKFWLLFLMTGCPIDLDSHQEVMLAVLEAARMRSPVNNINVILSEEKELTIKGRSYVFPSGTVAAASIGLASLDPDVFDEPYKFNPKRDNLVQNSLNFNHVGWNPVGAGRRQCPGRNIAMKFASDILIESRKKQGGDYGSGL